MIGLPEFFHDQIADPAARNHSIAFRTQLGLDSRDHGFDLIHGDLSLATGHGDSSDDFLTTEFIKTAVFLFDLEDELLLFFIGREAMMALEAGATSPDASAVNTDSAFQHLGIQVVALGAFQEFIPSIGDTAGTSYSIL